MQCIGEHFDDLSQLSKQSACSVALKSQVVDEEEEDEVYSSLFHVYQIIMLYEDRMMHETLLKTCLKLILFTHLTKYVKQIHMHYVHSTQYYTNKHLLPLAHACSPLMLATAMSAAMRSIMCNLWINL